jgi:uncharacterized protein
MWSEGDAIVVRYGMYGAAPETVVEHSEERLVTWVAPGTPCAFPVLADGSPLRSVPVRDRFAHPRASAYRPWHGAGILKIYLRGAAHSVWVFWHESGDHHGWYVNLEERHRWRPWGLATRDQVLDLWCEPPREWHWKDEDELAVAVEVGRLTPEEAREIRAEGERVAAMIERWESPFSDGWENWRPPPEWPVPALPENWRDLD